MHGLPAIGAPPDQPLVYLADGAGSAVNSRYGAVRVAALLGTSARFTTAAG
ncbi:hypothetical protein [Jiangella sp. DSM 45060]|uniref:hypothetical protein n=1 Tax=Jiangella sp. DSM 45060 TaxID=1798224 RepID=UPI0012FD8D6B|nr:hypothetical protein [Jiangella sp. DSM 45060]